MEVWPVRGQAAEHLIEDLIGPLGPGQPGLRQTDEQVAQGGRVEHVGVVDDGEAHGQASPICWVSAESSSAAPRRC